MHADVAGRMQRTAGNRCRVAVFAAILAMPGSALAAQEREEDTIPLGLVVPDTVALLSGQNTAAGRALARVLRSPHIVMDGRGRPLNLPRGTSFDSSLVIVSPRATVGATVNGDVIVVGGDLFTHPGARIRGDAIAIGGGVYQSTLGVVQGGVEAFRDETFEVSRAPGAIALAHSTTRIDYETRVVSWPLGVGVRVPSYTRVDGLVLPWGPYINLARGRILIDPTVTYRSDLGAVDPGLRATIEAGALRLVADARRATFSNDRWIRAEPQNSLSTLWSGRDTRNYYRADRIEGRAGVRVRPGNLVLEPYVGARSELAWSTGGELSRDSHPWSVFGRDSIDGIFRPNPPVAHGRIVSMIAGAALRWTPEDVRLGLSADLERAWDREASASPSTPEVGTPFTQLTLHGTVAFPTFAGQRLTARARAVTSSSGAKRPPPQRYAYLGGRGTIPTMDLLSEGGTELFHFATNYSIPVRVIQLPYVGSPTLTLRYMTGAAGIDELPRFTQNVGARLAVRFISAEFLMDPRTKEKRFGVGFAFTY
jgi:hypothetical protein